MGEGAAARGAAGGDTVAGVVEAREVQEKLAARVVPGSVGGKGARPGGVGGRGAGRCQTRCRTGVFGW